jgi:hypothetical protein
MVQVKHGKLNFTTLVDVQREQHCWRVHSLSMITPLEFCLILEQPIVSLVKV